MGTLNRPFDQAAVARSRKGETIEVHFDDHDPELDERPDIGSIADELVGEASFSTHAGTLVGTLIADRYRIDSVIDRGGMGIVYEASDLVVGRKVAVKLLLPQTGGHGPSYLRRFQREAKIMLAVRHESIVEVLDFGAAGPFPFIVMELLHGSTLEHWLANLGRLPTLDEVDEIMTHLLDAFEVAHGEGVVHRDIKPANVFVLNSEDALRVKVFDFGISKYDDLADFSASLTQTGVVSGTPRYMSPELCRSLKVGFASDLYSLGCVLSELLQGTPPFVGTSNVDTMLLHLHARLPPLYRPEGHEAVPIQLERLRVQLLSKSPADRPANIGEVARAWAEGMRARARTTGSGFEAGNDEPRSGEVTLDPAACRAVSQANLYRIAVRTAGSARGIEMSMRETLAHDGLALFDVCETFVDLAPFDALVFDAGPAGEEERRWLVDNIARIGKRPVLVCADRSVVDSFAAWIEAGASALVFYPIDPPTLLRRVRRLVDRGR